MSHFQGRSQTFQNEGARGLGEERDSKWRLSIAPVQSIILFGAQGGGLDF